MSIANAEFQVDKVIFHNTCPNCREYFPRAFIEDWPKQGYRQCATCGKYFRKEDFFLTAKIVIHPSQVPKSCPKCNSLHTKLDTQYFDQDFVFTQLQSKIMVCL